jgi:hypothetical protein
MKTRHASNVHPQPGGFSRQEWHLRWVNGRKIMVGVDLAEKLDITDRINAIRRALAAECRRRWGDGQLYSGELGLKWSRGKPDAAHKIA